MKCFKNRYVTLQIKQKHGTDAKLEERGASFCCATGYISIFIKKTCPGIM